ncbi:MAG: TIGR04282 family arsenosugar biosynthesis glycosyltransferase [Candidatus Methylacidiphilales bacterium]|nr:TIGR04282 family arsenosugar biosynthesis glycosyltransferase [Candidatus Methylacidiphilales bacterium]
MKPGAQGRRTTAALMLKAPVAGRVKTRLAAQIGAEEACLAYRSLASWQCRVVPVEWDLVVHHDPPDAGPVMRAWLGDRPVYRPQVSGDLGDRLLGALESHDFSLGALVFLGGDCPYLDAGILRQAEACLNGGAEVVLGPARDGGYVLLGLGAAHRGLFERIEWSTPRVLEQTCARAKAAGLSVHLLEESEDVDDAASWDRARSSGWNGGAGSCADGARG